MLEPRGPHVGIPRVGESGLRVWPGLGAEDAFPPHGEESSGVWASWGANCGFNSWVASAMSPLPPGEGTSGGGRGWVRGVLVPVGWWAPCRAGGIPACPGGGSEGGDTGRSRGEGARLWRAGAGGVHMAGVGGRPDLLGYNYCLKRLRISQPFFVTHSQGLFLPPLRARAPCQRRGGGGGELAAPLLLPPRPGGCSQRPAAERQPGQRAGDRVPGTASLGP